MQGLPVCEFSKGDESMIYVCLVNYHFGEVVQKLQNIGDTVVWKCCKISQLLYLYHCRRTFRVWNAFGLNLKFLSFCSSNLAAKHKTFRDHDIFQNPDHRQVHSLNIQKKDVPVTNMQGPSHIWELKIAQISSVKSWDELFMLYAFLYD